MAESSVQELIIKYRADVSDLSAKVTLIENKLRGADAAATKAGKSIQEGFNKGRKSVEETSARLGDTHSELGRLENRFQSIGEKVIAAFAVERLIHFGDEAVTAFAKAQVGALQLLGALKGDQPAQERLLKFGEEFSKKFLIPTTVINSQSAFLAIQGHTEAQIKKTLQAAAQLSAVTGEDLQSSVNKLSATFEGNIGRLGKLDKGFESLSKTQLENGAAVDLIIEKYNGFAEKGLEGVAGQIKRNELQIEEATIRLGQQIAPIELFIKKFESVWLEGLEGMFSAAKDLIDKNKSILANPFNLFRKGTTDAEDAQKAKDELEVQLNFVIKAYAKANKQTLEQLKAGAEEKLKTATEGQKLFLNAQIKAADELLKQQEDADEKQREQSTITLEHLKQQKEDLEKQLSKVVDPLTINKPQADALLKQILDLQNKIDEISGEAEKKRIEERKAASKKLIELEKKITEDLLKARGQNALEVLEAEKKNAENELLLTFSQSQKTLADKKNLNDALIKLDEEFAIKQHEQRLKNIQDAAKQNEEAGKVELDKIKSVFDSLKSEVDSQQINATIKVNQDFITKGDFSPEAERNRQQQILTVQEDFDKKRIDKQKQFVNDFIAEENKIIESITDNAIAQKNNIADSFFAAGDFSDAAFIEANIKIQKIDADTNKQIQAHAKETASVKNDLSKEITDVEAKESEARFKIAEDLGKKKLEIENEIRDTTISGIEDILVAQEKKSNDEQIKSIEEVRDAQLQSIDDQIAANDKARKDGAEGRKAYEEKNKELLAERVKAEDAAAAKIRAIKKQQFTADQIEAVSKVIIANTINAAEFPALTEFYAALAAIQIGIILARPNPYKKGTKSAKEGPALVGEEGPELVVMSKGSKVLTAKKTEQHADAVDAMIDGKFEEHVKKVFVEPALIEQARRISKTTLNESEVSERVTKTVTNILRNIHNDETESFSRAFSIADNAINISSNRPSIKIPEFSFQMMPVKKVFKTESIDRETLTVENLHTILSKLHVVEHLKEATQKHEIKKQEAFAQSIANSFFIQKDIVGMTAKQQRKIFKEGSPVTNPKEIARHMAKELAKLIPDNKPTARRYS